MNLIGRHIGNYVVQKQLGAGGMGVVYVCEHPLLGRKVALKVLHEQHARDPSTVERFFHEAKAANAIRHPNIVDVHDFGSLPGEAGEPSTVYLVMELLEGKSLSAALPGLTIEESLHVVRQCCQALAASHEKGIVHRDLKPENIFLVTHGDDSRFVKIVDFGIAKLMAPGEGSRTQMGTILGTPSYMSPEQCEGLGQVDSRADVYSLGVVLYEMLTKQLPFHADNFAALAVAHMTQPPVPPSHLNPKVTPELDAIVLHAMEKRPERRFQTMTDFLSALSDPATHLLGYQHNRADQPTMHAPRTGGTLILGVDDVVGVSPRVPPPAQVPMPPAAAVREETLQHAAAQVETPASPVHRRRGWVVAGAAAVVALAVAATLVLVLPGGSEKPHAAGTAATPPPASPLIVVPVAPPPPPVAVAPPPAPVPEPAPAPRVVVVVPDAGPAMVTVTITSEPPGALVTRDGVSLGPTPVTLTVAQGAAPVAIDLTRDGYAPEHRLVATDATRQIAFELRPLPPPKPAPPPRRRRANPDLKPLEL